MGYRDGKFKVEQEAHPYIFVQLLQDSEAEVLGVYDGEVLGSRVTLDLLPDQPDEPLGKLVVYYTQ